MQIKHLVRYHFTTIQRAGIKKTTNKCWWGCGEKRTPVHCWWECKLVRSLWKTVWRSLKKLKIELSGNPAILSHKSSSIYLKKKKNPHQFKKRYLHPYVHYSFIYNSWDRKATYVPINRWTNKEDVVYVVYIMEYYPAIKRMKSCHLQQHGLT